MQEMQQVAEFFVAELKLFVVSKDEDEIRICSSQGHFTAAAAVYL